LQKARGLFGPLCSLTYKKSWIDEFFVSFDLKADIWGLVEKVFILFR